MRNGNYQPFDRCDPSDAIPLHFVAPDWRIKASEFPALFAGQAEAPILVAQQ
jgi:hypothetical protein